MVTERYSLNVTPGGVPLVLNISQYDVGLRQFIFTPYTNEGILPKQDMVTVTLEATKRDGNGIIHPCTYNDDGTITYVLQDQLAPVKGKVFSKIRLRGVDSENLGMAAIIWVVDQAAVDDDTQFSDSDVAAIEEWLRLGAEYVVRTESAAEAAAESEANAKESENAAKASENAAAASETAAKASENAAKASENAAAASETNADISERNAYNSAANALVSERNAKDSEIRAKASENAAAASETVAVEKATEAVNTIDNFNSNLQDLVSEAVEGLYIHSDSVVIDKTLSIEGAAAEASETGKRIAGAMNMFPTAKATSLGPVVTYEGTVDGVPVKTFTYTIEPHQAGTGDPSPDNIRAITGYTSVDVTRAGKNLFDKSVPLISGYIDEHGNVVIGLGYSHTDYIPVAASTTYTTSGDLTPGDSYRNTISYFNASKAFIGRTVPSATGGHTFETPSDCAYIMMVLHDPNVNTVQLELGSTATTYEPYQGQTESITFPTEAGTVYGGTLVKNADGSGTLTVTMATVDLGTLNWNYGGDGYFQSESTPAIKPVASQDIAANILCSKYATDTSQHVYGKTVDKAIAISTGTANVRIRDTSYTDAASFKAAMSGVTLVYEVASPVTYAISASDMAEISTLLGDNTVWMSADGEFTSFEYRVGRIIDPTLTVEGASADAKAIGEAIEAVKEIVSDEDTITVTSNYAVGSLVRVGDALYETTTVVVTGETLNPGTNCTPTTIKDQLIKRYTKSDTDSLLSEKADTDGNYPDLTAGNANQLVTTVGIEDETPYLFRTSAGGLEIGDREIDELVGGTVAWNQLITFTTRTVTTNGVTASYDAQTGEIILNGTSTARTLFAVSNNVPGVVGHKVLLKGAPSSARTDTYFMTEGYSAYADTGKGTIGVVSRDSQVIQIVVQGGQTLDNMKFVPQLFDLTAMFGPTIANYIYSLEQSTAGAGVAWFRNYFPKYYPYDPGSLKSVEGLSAHKTVGFNQWDEEWEFGTYLNTNGQKYPSSTKIRNKNPIPVLPNTAYVWSVGTTSADEDRVWCYDHEMNFIKSFQIVHQTSLTLSFTTPINCYYVNFAVKNTTYNHDICINLSSDRNGEYEPYVKNTYPLDSTIKLQGIFKLDSANRLYADGDIYPSDGQVKRRYGTDTIDGSAAWRVNETAAFRYFDGETRYAVAAWSTDLISNLFLANLSGTSGRRIQFNSVGNIRIVVPLDDPIATVADLVPFLSANPLEIVYLLATPTTEQADPYTNPQIVDNYGTEEYVTSGIVPVGHNTKYLQDLKSKLESAPDSPDADGDYIMRQTSGVNSYAPLASAPAINGLTTRMSTAEGNIADVTPKAEEALARATAALIAETSSGSVVTIDDGADGIDSKGYTLTIEPHQAGSGDPSPDNVRAITGYTSVDVTRAGKNLLPREKYQYTSTIVTVGASNISSAYRRYKAGTYAFSCDVTVSSGSYYSVRGDVQNRYIGAPNGTFTLAEDSEVEIHLYRSGGLDIDSVIDWQLEAGDTATAYEPYITPLAESIPFPSEAGTVYGGTLTKNADGSGTLTVDRGLFNQWNGLNRGKVNDAGTGRTFYALWTNLGDFRNSRPYPLISSYLQLVDSPRTYEALGAAQVYRNNENYFVFCTENPDDTLETMQQWIATNGIQVYVALASPSTYTIPAEDMAKIPTLKGDNTVWMSADGSISLDYCADTKLYINKLLSQ